MVIIAIAIENTMMHIADEVAHSTPLVTVLFFEIVSREASAHLSFSALSAAPVISPENNFRIKGNRNASEITPKIRQKAAKKILVLRKKNITASTPVTMPTIRPVLLNLYSVSLLSKMMSLIEILSAFMIARSGMKHSIAIAPVTTPAGSSTDMTGMSKDIDVPSVVVPVRSDEYIELRISEYRTAAGTLPRTA